MKTIFILHFAFFVLLFSVGKAQDTIYVPQDFASIQQGIDAAVDNDVVLVSEGIYLENINFNGKAITVASFYLIDGSESHIDNTIIDGGQNGPVVTFNTAEDSTSVLCGFTITGGTGMTETDYGARIGGGIVCYYAAAKIIRLGRVATQMSG